MGIAKFVSNGIYNVDFIRFRLDKDISYSDDVLFEIKAINHCLDKLSELITYFNFNKNVRVRADISKEYGIVSEEDKEKIEKLKKLLYKTESYFKNIENKINASERIFMKNVFNVYKIYVMQLDYQIKYFKKNAKLAIEHVDKNYLEDITEEHIMCMNEKTYQEIEDEFEDFKF